MDITLNVSNGLYGLNVVFAGGSNGERYGATVKNRGAYLFFGFFDHVAKGWLTDKELFGSSGKTLLFVDSVDIVHLF